MFPHASPLTPRTTAHSADGTSTPTARCGEDGGTLDAAFAKLYDQDLATWLEKKLLEGHDKLDDGERAAIQARMAPVFATLQARRKLWVHARKRSVVMRRRPFELIPTALVGFVGTFLHIREFVRWRAVSRRFAGTCRCN